MPLKHSFPEKWSNVSPERFFTVSSENTAFFEKIVKYKNFWHVIFHKKGFIIHFSSPDAPFHSKGTWLPETVFRWGSFWKIKLFLKTLLNNKVLGT